MRRLVIRESEMCPSPVSSGKMEAGERHETEGTRMAKDEYSIISRLLKNKVVE
jgi:hypothetical protein